MTKLTLHLDGMGCRACVREVTARLRDVPGVETVTADHRRSVVLLTGSMSRDDVGAALKDTRFKVMRISADSDQTGAGQWPRRPFPP
jgi:copper chaperone CopZ